MMVTGMSVIGKMTININRGLQMLSHMLVRVGNVRIRRKGLKYRILRPKWVRIWSKIGICILILSILTLVNMLKLSQCPNKR